MKKDSRSLDGQWLTLIPPRSAEDTDPALEDLDQIVREYSSRDEKNKAPVVLGSLIQGSQEPVARIDEVRRAGNSLEGKFGAVDPRVEFLHGCGVFPKKSVRLKRSPGAVSLDSVGLVQSRSSGEGRDYGTTPSLDKLMKEHSGMHEAIFGETMKRPDFSHGHVSLVIDAPEICAQVAQNAISDLKKRARWCDRFDRFGLPAVFAEMAGSRAFPLLSTFVNTVVEHDPTCALISECARYFAREKGISFSEALDVAMEVQKATGDPLTDLAYTRSKERSISFSEALDQIAEERPELATLGHGRRSTN